MKYLIIGGKSFLGEPLADRLLKKDNTEEIIATKLPREKAFERERMSWTDLDLRDYEETVRVVKEADADVIFDFATEDSVAYAWKNPKETVDINIIGTINLLNSLRELQKKPRLVIGGSGEEYGRVDFDCIPINENGVPKPVNIYGATKASQTMFAKLYARAYDMDIVVVRTFNYTASSQGDRFAVSNFCHQFVKIEKGEQNPVVHVGNINNRRDFTDVDDLVRAFEMIAEKGKTGEVYNAARGEATSLKEIIDMLQDITGIKVDIKMDRSKVRPIDPPVLCADISKIEQEIGWRAEISIEQILRNLLGYWREAGQ